MFYLQESSDNKNHILVLQFQYSNIISYLSWHEFWMAFKDCSSPKFYIHKLYTISNKKK